MTSKKLKILQKEIACIFVVFTLFIGAIVTPLSSSSNQNDGTRAEADTLVSIYTETTPMLDNMALWDDVPETTVLVSGGNINGDVTLQSMYNDTHVFIKAEWADTTLSMVRGDPWIYNPIPADTMRSVMTETVPAIDGDGSEAVWNSALPLTIAVSGGNNPTDVTVKSLYNDTHIFMQSQWNDSTFSLLRGGGSWFWNDTDEGKWDHTTGGSEDRIAYQWDMNATGFDTQGCMVKCHGAGEKVYLNTPGERTDMWHMKAARSLGAKSSNQVGTPTITDFQPTAGEFYLSGWADDKYVTYDEEPFSEDGGRHGDGGSSTYARNRNASKGSPKYIEKDPDDWLDAMILNQWEIDEGETVAADPDDSENYDAQDVQDAWDKYDALGAAVPERILRPATDSRADILQSGGWKDGVWTVESVRLLDTGNDDDVQFDDLSGTYDFGVSVMDNAGGTAHDFHTGVYHMDFTPDFTNVAGNSEDRIAFLWNIQANITDFDTQGCMVKCHVSDGKAYLNVPGEVGDIWHMKSGRSLPVISSTQTGTPTIVDYQATSGRFEFEGFIDDKHLTYDEAPFGEDGGRHGDEGSSTYGRNRNGAKTAPLYMETNPADYIDAMVITQAEIDDGETLEVATATDSEIANAAANYETLNALVPERILRPPTGSRADITQSAIWEDGMWYTIITRELVTGNDDDIQFDDLEAPYSFGLSLMDNAGGTDHSTTGASIKTLTFEIPNDPPEDVDAGANQNVETSSTVTLNGTATDPENDSLTFTWNFGDGTGNATGQQVTHSYATADTYTVTLTVDDGNGNVVTDTLSITAELPPDTYTLDVGPIKDGNGDAVEGVKVKIAYNGTDNEGTTGNDGVASIEVPADWAEKTVTATISKSGYDPVTVEGTISAGGEFTPTAGSYPSFVKEEDDDDNGIPGFELVLVLMSMLGGILIMTRKRRT